MVVPSSTDAVQSSTRLMSSTLVVATARSRAAGYGIPSVSRVTESYREDRPENLPVDRIPPVGVPGADGGSKAGTFVLLPVAVIIRRYVGGRVPITDQFMSAYQ